ncbi:MAG: ATP-dependent zinc metalloprotease FtsH [Dehalococcoidia bacterium]|nr:ATP-dependent zinc metalloprotease FtsH [Dehalococcoidia bacterium]
MSSRWLRNSFIYLLILVAVIAIVVSFFRSGDSTKTEPFSSVVAEAKAGQLEKIEVSGRSLTITKKNDPTKYKSEMGSNTDLEQTLSNANVTIGGNSDNSVTIKYNSPSSFGGWLTLLINFLPIIFIAAILIFFMRQAQGSNSQAMNFGKSRARMFNANKPTVTFQDVAGVDEAKEELAEVVEFLKYPEKFASLGARIPRGVLLVGPPGTGKTLLSRACAGEAGVPFFSISGSEFVEMFVGVGASRVRDLFDQAKRNSPCIVFVDEIDAVGRQRGAGLGGSHDEREQTLNQILVEMDGFDTNTNVIVIAATNRPDILDPALLRPGRFDRQVILDRPDSRGRQMILEVHTKGKPFDKDVELQTLARQTPGFSGADLANLVNEAAILAARRNKKKISMAEFNEAVDRVIAGPERKSRVITPKEKKIIAYHEAGHALVGHLLPNADPPYKISIVSRGLAGGFTRFLPEEDRHLMARSQFKDMLATSLGGLVAEELILDGESTTGPSDDLNRATSIARNMVTQWGMSERLGPRTFGNKQEMIFLGREIGEQRNYSEKVAEEIDEEVRRLVDHAYQTARSIIMANKDRMEKLVDILLEEETIEGDDLRRVLDGLDKQPPATPEAPVPPAPPAEEMREPEEKPAPKPNFGKPGLAWGSSSQNIALDAHSEPPEA